MLLRDFSGGLNTRVAPHLLQINEAQEYTNIDSASGALRSLKGPTSTGIPIDQYFTYFYADDEWVSRTTEADFVEYRDKLYISDGNILKSYSNLTLSNLGITAPTVDIPISDIPIGDTTSGFTFVNTSGDLVPNETYTYRVAYYSTTLGSTVYKEYDFLISSAYTTGCTVSFNAIGLNTDYFANGDLITLYRRTSTGYKKIGSIAYNVAGVSITDATLNVSTSDSLVEDTLSKVYNYVYTYYDSVNDIESLPGIPSIDTTGPNGTLVGAIPKSAEASVTSIRVYRIGGALSQYTLIDTLANPAVSTTPYVDVKVDIDVVGSHILDSYSNNVPITGLQYLTEAYAMLFAAKGDKLYYSEIGKPYAWPTTSFLDFDATITGIGAISNGFIVCTAYKTYIVTGNSPETFSKYLLSSSQGCVSHRTMSFVDNSLLWLSTDGICTTNGGPVSVLSQIKLGKLSIATTYSSAVLDNIYYLSHDTVLGKKILAFDFRYNQIVRYIDVLGTMVVSANDTLYQFYNSTLQTLLTGDELSMTYKSPILTEGSYSNRKVFKDIYIKYNGTFTIVIAIDGTVMNTVVLEPGNKAHTIKLNDKAKGYGLEFSITGIGEVSEIEYAVLGRQDVKVQ